MRKIEPQDLLAKLESGFRAAPLQSGDLPQPVNACLIVRETPDPASGHFVVIRTHPKATIYLGCLADASGRPLEWLEIWVQNVLPAQNLNPAYRDALTNAALDKEWLEMANQLRGVAPEEVISSPYETTSPLPIWIDAARGASVHPTHGGRHWRLCHGEDLLKTAGLPPYSTSLARYLFSPAGGDGGPFVPVTPLSPTGPKTADLAQAIPESAQLAPFNPGGNLLLLKRFAPLTFEDFTEVLSGKAWRGVENARKAFHPGGVYQLLEDEDLLRCGAAHLFSASRGKSGRFSETLHLKLLLISQALRLVREQIRKTQLPMLNLTADSFRVRLGATGLDVPFLWTQQVSLAQPGLGFALPISSSTERYFQPVEPLTASIYRPAELAIPKSGAGSVRIRKVTPGRDGIVIEGTLTTYERLGVDESELIWLTLPIVGGKVDLYGFRDTSQAMAGGEAVFRTIPQQFAPAVASALESVAGVPFNQAPFSILPPLSSPCDLYSLGVLATRVLLVNARNTLPQALDAILSLGRQLANSPDPNLGIGDRVAQIAGSDPRWMETLGPQHLRAEQTTADDAFTGVPAKLWWDVLATVARFFPSPSSDSYCKGFGDAPSLALHGIFDKPSDEWTSLCIRSRALITLEWEQNVEIAGLIAAAEQQFGG